MKKILLPLLFLIAIGGSVFSQQLYSNTVETGSRFNPGIGQSGTPKAAFDDVLIPSSTVAGSDSIRVTKVKVGIRRIASAPATNVSVYYTPVEDTATLFNNFIKIPPVLIGTVTLPANGAAAVTTIVSFGDSITTLFRLKTDTGNVYTGFHTFFIGIALSNVSSDNGIRLTSGPGANDDVMWIYNSDSTVKRFATFFGGVPAATFYIQAFGYPVGGTVPVTLAEFKGERKGNVNALSWTTLTEQNSAGFDLQRSADGLNFSSLAFIPSKASGGNSTGRLDYSFDDVKPFIASGYYRLKQTDKDGKSTISKVILIKGAKLTSIQLSSIYPNPAANVLNIVVAAPASDKISLVVTDLTGKIVLQQTSQVVSGNNNLSLDVAKLAAGSYIIKAVCAGGCETVVSNFVKD